MQSRRHRWVMTWMAIEHAAVWGCNALSAAFEFLVSTVIVSCDEDFACVCMEPLSGRPRDRCCCAAETSDSMVSCLA